MDHCTGLISGFALDAVASRPRFLGRRKCAWLRSFPYSLRREITNLCVKDLPYLSKAIVYIVQNLKDCRI